MDSRLYFELYKHLRIALSNALKDRTLSEPQLIANMVFYLPQAINQLTTAKRYPLSAGGIFIHSSPFVTYSSLGSGSVELGDLLLLRTEIQNGGRKSSSALLLQAKKVNKTPPIKPDNSKQHYLYAEWPEFKYVRSPVLTGLIRHIEGPDLYNASQYLLLGDTPICDAALCFCYCAPYCLHSSFPLHFTLTAQPTQPELSHYRCFIGELLNFILGNSGKNYISPAPQNTIGWDQVISDLITVTAQKVSSYMGHVTNNDAQTGRPTRGENAGLCFYKGSFSSDVLQSIGNSSQNNDERPPEIRNDKLDGGGISIIEFTISSDEYIKNN